MNAEQIGIDPDDVFADVRVAKRMMTATLTAATQAEPPHLVDVLVVNDQHVGLWYTIEPFNEVSEQALQGWDVVRKRFVTFPWPKVVNVRSNSLSYNRATAIEWQQRQLHTNLQWDEDKQVRQTKGVFWRGKRAVPRPARKIRV